MVWDLQVPYRRDATGDSDTVEDTAVYQQAVAIATMDVLDNKNGTALTPTTVNDMGARIATAVRGLPFVTSEPTVSTRRETPHKAVVTVSFRGPDGLRVSTAIGVGNDNSDDDAITTDSGLYLVTDP